MNEADISVAVTAHSETVVAGPTMHSAEMAIRAAEAEGLRIERLIGLDAASDACREFFMQPAFSEWKVELLDNRDLGASRNDLAMRAKGRWIAFLDADDLFSYNWLLLGVERLRLAEKVGERVIVHPEMNWFFDGAASLLVNPAQHDPLFTPIYFYIGNYYDSLCIAPRKLHVEIPYVRRDVKNGIGFEDWRWNIETASAGWRHVIAEDTILFKRRQDSSLVIELGKQRSVLWKIEAMAIDSISCFSQDT